jgi:integrative and conjugative element protein (TIGR02256 family)
MEISNTNILTIDTDIGFKDKIKKYQQKPNQKEKGGYIVGEIYPKSNKVVIKDLIVSNNAKDSRYGVVLDRYELQQKLEDITKSSNYTYHYLGEWHTHPEAIPKPSPKDWDTFYEVTTNIKSQSNFVIFMIIGNSKNIEETIYYNILIKSKPTFKTIYASSV